MPFTLKYSFLVLVTLVFGALAGCQQQTNTASTHKTGSYAAARHMSVGSNIPQRESVDSTGATYDPEQFQQFQNQQATRSMGGGGTR